MLETISMKARVPKQFFTDIKYGMPYWVNYQNVMSSKVSYLKVPTHKLLNQSSCVQNTMVNVLNLILFKVTVFFIKKKKNI